MLSIMAQIQRVVLYIYGLLFTHAPCSYSCLYKNIINLTQTIFSELCKSLNMLLCDQSPKNMETMRLMCWIPFNLFCSSHYYEPVLPN